MKSFTFLIFFFASNYLFAQNVGIGTTSPGATLDVVRGTGSLGTAAFRGTTYTSHFNFGTTENTYIRGGKAGSHVILNDLSGGNVGIGIDNPPFLLSFPSTAGDKISLYGNTAGSPHYGFGVQSYLFQIHSDISSSDIAFGYGLSSSFTENMRIKGNGTVGIGTSSPGARLDLTKPGADTPTMNIRGSANISHFYYGANEDTYIRGGKAGSNVIINDAPGSGNVGIGTGSPMFPLSFPGSFGDKISLWNDGTTTHYGFGIQAGLFQVFAKTANDVIAFGYGSSSAFTETMRIRGNGNVGIGNDPAYLFDVNGRMRIRSGGSNSVSAGLWLNNNANMETAFIGMEDDSHVGLFGNNGAGWKFTMNTQTGGLKVNGSEGTAGMVLTSGGNAGPSSWQNLGTVLPSFYLFNSVDGPNRADVNSNAEFTLPNSTFTFSVPVTSRLIISASYLTYGVCLPIGSCGTLGEFYFKVDGNSTETQRVSVMGGYGESSGTLSNYFYDVTAGSHTIVFYTKNQSYGGGGGRYEAFLTSASVIVLPL